MKVYKFGGASIRDAASIRNLYQILRQDQGKPLVIVVSAMGKTTNRLEQIIASSRQGKPFEKELEKLALDHLDLIRELRGDPSPSILEKLDELGKILRYPSDFPDEDMFYDAVIAFGELLSSLIIVDYLLDCELPVRWIDARKIIRTDDVFREANVDWDITCRQINEVLNGSPDREMVITQGFIGVTDNGHTTSLGREGSDFSAAIMGYCLKAESVTIWKDVPGILNADPKRFGSTTLYENLSYQEAAEMTYYGASVIHPKTIKPLANQKIPLYVRSFLHPELPGTLIDAGKPHRLPPTYVVKEDQCLVSFHVRDLDFISEKNLSIIFHVLDMLHIRINMMQNSAVSITICVDFHADRLKALLDTLRHDFDIRYNTDLWLYTVKNYTDVVIEELSEGRNILVEQRTRNTYQIVVKPEDPG